jgi:hypothetical protein
MTSGQTCIELIATTASNVPFSNGRFSAESCRKSTKPPSIASAFSRRGLFHHLLAEINAGDTPRCAPTRPGV